jgi:hypothetical protein
MIRVPAKLWSSIRTYCIIAALPIMGVGLFVVSPVQAAQLEQRSLQLSNSIPGETSNYAITMNIPTSDTLGSIKVEFCANSAILYLSCTAPTGFDVSGASIASQTGISGFTVDASTTSNVLILSRTPDNFAGGVIAITLSNVTNQSVEASSFARYYTYATDDASGPVTDDGAVAYSINDDFAVSAEVPPYLTLCVGVAIATDCSSVAGDFVQLGELSSARSSSGQSQVAVATNAGDGYTVRVTGATMTSGNNTIPPMTNAGSSAVGTSQFGINLRANTAPSMGADPDGPGVGQPSAAYGQVNIFKYASGDIVAGSSVPDDFRRYTVSYLVNISRNQQPGVYSSTFSYVALGNF